MAVPPPGLPPGAEHPPLPRDCRSQLTASWLWPHPLQSVLSLAARARQMDSVTQEWKRRVPAWARKALHSPVLLILLASSPAPHPTPWLSLLQASSDLASNMPSTCPPKAFVLLSFLSGSAIPPLLPNSYMTPLFFVSDVNLSEWLFSISLYKIAPPQVSIFTCLFFGAELITI